MSVDFWYGVLALPAAALLAFVTIWLALRIWTGLLKLADLLPRKLRKPKGRYGEWAGFLEDGDNRLEHVGILATADNLHVWNTPVGVFMRAGGRIDYTMARMLREMMKDKIMQDAKDERDQKL
ncbi:MAG TPA: hypothetical protein VIG71_02325 [Enteractinococcus sp.]